MIDYIFYEKTEALIEDLIDAVTSGAVEGSVPLVESFKSGCGTSANLTLFVTCKNGHTIECKSSPCDFGLCFNDEITPATCLDAYKLGFTESGMYDLLTGSYYCDFEGDEIWNIIPILYDFSDFDYDSFCQDRGIFNAGFGDGMNLIDATARWYEHIIGDWSGYQPKYMLPWVSNDTEGTSFRTLAGGIAPMTCMVTFNGTETPAFCGVRNGLNGVEGFETSDIKVTDSCILSYF